MNPIPFFHGLLCDPRGKPSTTRFTLLVWNAAVLVVWCYLSVSSGILVPIDSSILVLLTGMSIQKLVQGSQEHKTERANIAR